MIYKILAGIVFAVGFTVCIVHIKLNGVGRVSDLGREPKKEGQGNSNGIPPPVRLPVKKKPVPEPIVPEPIVPEPIVPEPEPIVPEPIVVKARLLRQVRPQYPPLARQARIQGTVKLSATIAKDGTVQKLEVIDGHPLLVPAALAAVKQWRYSPALLNGEAVEVLADIALNFTL